MRNLYVGRGFGICLRMRWFFGLIGATALAMITFSPGRWDQGFIPEVTTPRRDHRDDLSQFVIGEFGGSKLLNCSVFVPIIRKFGPLDYQRCANPNQDGPKG